MNISCFTQSLFAVDIFEAIEIAARAGYDALEIACGPRHLTRDIASNELDKILDKLKACKMPVAALSLFTTWTNPHQLNEQLENSLFYCRLANRFGTDLVKMMPGNPSSAEATDEHWEYFRSAMAKLIPELRNLGVRAAFETHLNQLSDRLSSTQRMLELLPEDVAGITLDVCNIQCGGDNPVYAVRVLASRLFHTHIKDARLSESGSCKWLPIGTGDVDYPQVLRALHEVDYSGYLSIECLYDDTFTAPEITVNRDRVALAKLLPSIPQEG